MKFSEFNNIVNPNNENCYMVESSAGIRQDVSFQEAKMISGTDPKAVIYWKITQGFFVIKVKEPQVLDIIQDRNEQVMVVKHNKEFEIYCKGAFDKTTTNNLLACGLNADTLAHSKAGNEILIPFRNTRINTSPAYNAIDIVYENGIAFTPKWLQPTRRLNSPTADGIQLPITSNAQTIILNHIHRLKNMNKFEQADIINIINDYFSTSPLTADEIKVIVEELEMTLLAQFVDKSQFYHNKLGDYVIDACHIKRDENSKKLYFWNQKKNIYTDDSDFLMGYLTRLCPQLKQYQKDETEKYILNYLFEDSVNFNTSEYSVVFKNGILDVLHWTFEPMTPDHYESIQINTEYNPSATGATADEFFSTATCGDKDVEQLLYEAIGYSMLKTNELAKAFMLTGNGRNGKSTYLEIMKKMLGIKNYSAISFKDLSNNFRAANLIDKLASLAGDISAQPIQESDLFKSIAAAEDIMLEQKYKQAFVGKLFSTMFFSCNKLPKTPDTSDGFYRRFVIVPFNANLSKVSTVDGIEFKQRLLSDESIQYMAYKALQAIHKVLTTTKEFIEPTCVVEIKKQYRIDNSSVLSWFQDKYKMDIDKLKKIDAKRAYGSYTAWCNEANRPAASSTSFTQQLKAEFGIELPA